MRGHPELRYRKRWDRCRLEPQELEKVTTAIHALPEAMSGQFHNLDIGPVKQTRHRDVWRLKVPPFRVLFQTIGSVLLVLEMDRRDDNTYKNLDRLIWRRSGNGVEIVEHVADEQVPEATVVRGLPPQRPPVHAERPNPLMPFSDPMLRDLGLDDDAVRTVRSLRESVDIALVLAERHVDPEVIEVVADAWHDPTRYLEIFDGGQTPTVDDARIGTEELVRRVTSSDSSTSIAALGAAELEQVLLAPIDEWMFYLHPSQARVVQHAPTGPSRVRGGPGSGKTVAALHRAKHLVRQGEAKSVLLTTFVRVLPTTWRRILDEFAPQEADRITTSTVDTLARQIVTEAEPLPELLVDDQRRTPIAAAALRVGDVQGRSEAWFLTEVDAVIAGRGLRTVEEYLEVSRVGRGSALPRDERQRVWNAYLAYRKRLERQRATDFAHLRQRALELARTGHGPRFDAIIVDESQDLTGVHIELLKALDRREDHRAMMLVGDGQQSIYPGGFSLRSADLDVRGRSWVLRSNWRNTQRVIDAAEIVLGDQVVRDFEFDDTVAGDGAPPRRLGTAPELHLVANVSEGDELIADLIREALVDLSPNEVAILGRKRAVVREQIEPVCKRLKVPFVWLNELAKQPDGRPDALRIGTFEYSKGLEFKLVVLVGPDRAAWSVNPFWLNAAEDQSEWWNTERRRLFVAMTRARDRLALVACRPLPPVLDDAAPKCAPYEWA